MVDPGSITRLDPPVDEATDHLLGAPDAAITLVEYGSYDCPHCRAANERIAEVRDRFGDRLRYGFRHRPVPGSERARRAAELVEQARTPEAFWRAHVALMTRSDTLTEEDLRAVASDLGVEEEPPERARERAEAARRRVDADIASARASGVLFTPTFFINGRRYDGLWAESSFTEAMLGSLGHRVRTAALDFARWAPSAGVLLVLAAILSVAVTNSALGPRFLALWQTSVGLTIGERALSLPLLTWINSGLLTIFFLVVGLEIKREFTVGRLASPRAAALPVAAALGGMMVPPLIYLLVIPDGPWVRGWAVPMATDTAFAIALIAMLGSRVPIELRVFLTAAAIVDDIGAITVVALFYAGDLRLEYLVGAAFIAATLALLNRFGVYRLAPFLGLGVVLWAMVFASGLSATLAGVILAMLIPTREPANLRALLAQANAILIAEARHSAEVLRRGPSEPALRALEAIHERLESPADRLLRVASVRSSYLVLPIFALANAGVALEADALSGLEPLALAIGLGLVVGKPVGMVAASWLAVHSGLATKPREYGWAQLVGAGALAGIGFTMSLYIASESFSDPASFAAAKIALFAGSILSAMIGTTILWRAGRRDAESLAPLRSRPPAAPVTDPASA